MLEGFQRAESILEVGCGTGHFTRWLGQTGWTAVGLDLSAAMLREAQALNRVPLLRGDAFRLPFADGGFDVTAMVATLEFLDRPEIALAEAVRVARHGVLLGVLNRWSLLALQRRLRGLFQPTAYDSAKFYGVGALEQLLRAGADDSGPITWRTTLFPGWGWRVYPWPWRQAKLPWGGFIAMAWQRA